MRSIFFVIFMTIYGSSGASGAPKSTVLTFSMSGGEWQAQHTVTKRRDLSGARMAVGARFWEPPAYLTLLFDTKQIHNLQTLGHHGTSAGYHHHQWEGLGLGATWHGPFYHAWMAYGGGRVRVDQTRVGRDRYRYFFNEAGLGVALYQSEAAGISFFYAAHQEMPDAAWRNDYGYRRPLVQSLGVSLSLYSHQ